MSEDFVEEFDSDDEAAPAPVPSALPMAFKSDGSFLEMMLAQQAQQQQEEIQEMPDDMAATMGFSGGFGGSSKKTPAGGSSKQIPAFKKAGPPKHPLWQTLTVSAQSAGAALSKWLSETLPSEAKWSRNKAAAAVKEGEVRVNGETTGANRRIEAGDIVTVHAVPPCTLTDEEILSLISQRREAKIAREFAAADRIHAQLMAAGARVNDRDGKWFTNDGRSGVIDGGGAGKTSITAAKEDATTPGGGSGSSEGATKVATDEAERRRLKNKKKREARERKEKEAAAAKRPKVAPDGEGGEEGTRDGVHVEP